MQSYRYPTPINWARVERIIAELLTSYPGIDRTLAKRFFGWVYKYQDPKRKLITTAWSAARHHRIELHKRVGYVKLIGEYFGEQTDRFGNLIPERKRAK